MKKVSILDYGVGNVKSIANSFLRIGATPKLIKDQYELINSDFLVLPGVGAFGNAMDMLRNKDLINPIQEYIKKGNPFLGICLGMQLLFDSSDEFGIHSGFGLIEGKVLKFKPNFNDRLPNVGWYPVKLNKKIDGKIKLFKNLKENKMFYFIHSHYVSPSNVNNILSTSFYSKFEFCSAVQKNNICGVQFHPEKSGEIGLSLLKNFIKL